MLLEIILTPVFWLLDLLITLIPDLTDSPYVSDGGGVSALFAIMGYGFYVFPASMFFIIIGNVLFWFYVQMKWAIIEWLYKKIPGVN
jgi:hypothetical protein